VKKVVFSHFLKQTYYHKLTVPHPEVPGTIPVGLRPDCLWYSDFPASANRIPGSASF